MWTQRKKCDINTSSLCCMSYAVWLTGFSLSVYGSSDNDNDNDNSGSSERSREQTDGGFSQGYDDGEEDARQDYINGENFHDSCSFDHSNSYCLGYKSGYRVGWTAAQLLH